MDNHNNSIPININNSRQSNSNNSQFNINQNYAGSAPPNHYGYGYTNYDNQSNKPIPAFNLYGTSPVSNMQKPD